MSVGTAEGARAVEGSPSSSETAWRPAAASVPGEAFACRARRESCILPEPQRTFEGHEDQRRSALGPAGRLLARAEVDACRHIS